MLRMIRARLRQGHRTTRYPAGPPPSLPARYAGMPAIDGAECPSGCSLCIEACPAGAVARCGGSVSIDTGMCVFCGACETACPRGAIRFTREHRLASRDREGLMVKPGAAPGPRDVFDAKAASVFGRSLKLRQVSAGGCNACEADTNVLGTVGWDLGRFGIQFVASPRHADGLLVTGPVTLNMREALLSTYDAVPEPRIVIVTGACAISGGLFRGMPATSGGVEGLLPVDLYIPGCPPHPLTILDSLLRFLGRTGPDGLPAQGGRNRAAEPTGEP